MLSDYAHDVMVISGKDANPQTNQAYSDATFPARIGRRSGDGRGHHER